MKTYIARVFAQLSGKDNQTFRYEVKADSVEAAICRANEKFGKENPEGVITKTEIIDSKLKFTTSDPSSTPAPKIDPDRPVVDFRIISLQQLRKKGLSSVSASKRARLKEAKEVATWVVKNWFDLELLKGLSVTVDDYGVNEIIRSRIEELTPKAAPTKKSANPDREIAGEGNGTVMGKLVAKKARQIGERHPNGKWVWTEYAKGKFDWRTDPKLKSYKK